MELKPSLAKLVAVGVSAMLVLTTAPVHSAPHAVNPQQAVERLLEQAQTRQERLDLFQEALSQPEVQTRATAMGVDAAKISQTLPHLSDAELEELAQRASTVKDVAAGHHGPNVGLILFGTALLVTAIVVLAVAAGDSGYYDDDYYYDDCGCW